MNSRKQSTGGPYHHAPVMLTEVLEAMTFRGGNVFVDGTFGGGGHTKALLSSSEDCEIIAIDRDNPPIDTIKKLEKEYQNRFKFYNTKFSNLPDVFAKRAIEKVDGILLDLGVSSFQLDDSARGFSFQKDGPLDMRMGLSDITAADIINNIEEDNLSALINTYGEERHSRILAKHIIESRKKSRIESTLQLSEIVKKSIGWAYKNQKGKYIHPATRTFQALRIAVNSELEEISKTLSFAGNLLDLGGRLVVITFHSIEDRIVKSIFNNLTNQNLNFSRYDPIDFGKDNSFIYPSKKFIKPSKEEIELNPRARSAKLRYIERTDKIFRENLDISSINKSIKLLRGII
tara:strand:- start:11184 stop:12221 length:1038 start_codon:yes stop_codon:yes gene_type:complete